MKFTDPDGEFVTGFAMVFGFIQGFFSQGSNRFLNGRDNARRLAKNELRIWEGLIKTDENKPLLGKIWEVVSRFTWQAPQTITGLIVGIGANMIGQVNQVNSRYGVTVLDTKFKNGAFTLGTYILGPPGFKPDWKDHLFVHEYGHYIQSQYFGPTYLMGIGVPSFMDSYLVDELFNVNLHDTRWYEASASRMGSNYFDQYFGSKAPGYVSGSSNFFDKNSFILGTPSRYLNPRTGRFNRSTHPTNGILHWTDALIGGGFSLLFHVLKF